MATHFNTAFAEEYAREYLSKLGRKHTFQDLKNVAKGQVANQLKAEKKAKGIVFYDTDLLTIKIWAEDKYQKEVAFVKQNLKSQSADLYLLCTSDLDWVKDQFREDENRLLTIFNLYVKELESLNLNYKIIRGKGSARFENAVLEIEKYTK